MSSEKSSPHTEQVAMIQLQYTTIFEFFKIPTCGWVKGTPMFPYNKNRKNL